MYLTSVEDSIAGGPERLDYGMAFIQWQIQGVYGRKKTPFYRHPHSNLSPYHITWWAATDDPDERWDAYEDYRPTFNFVDDFPRPMEFYASPSFMGAPDLANFPVPRFGLEKGIVASWVVPTLARANPISVDPIPIKSASFNATSNRISRGGWATATYTPKASRFLSWRSLGTGIRQKLKLLPRSVPAPVIIIDTTA